MRLVTYSRQGQERLGIVCGASVVDLEELARQNKAARPYLSDMASFLAAGEPALELAQRLSEGIQTEDLAGAPYAHRLDSIRLRPPVPRPSKIIALGLNYREHAAEQDVALPKNPLIFGKFPNSLTGPYDPIVIPREDPQVDYEGELGVVIGRRSKRISEGQWQEHVAGYLVLNDVSARQWQFSEKKWTRAKSVDTFTPTGPWLTTREEIPDPHNLRLETRVSGETRQRSNTNDMIFRIPYLLAFLSAHITLEPGDIIATGTPPGVGVFRKPPTFLKAGDILETEIECLGRLRNPVVKED